MKSDEVKPNFFFSNWLNTLILRRRSRFKFFAKITTSDYGLAISDGRGFGIGKNGPEVGA